jgi:hypothetical protein
VAPAVGGGERSALAKGLPFAEPGKVGGDARHLL